MSEGFSPGAFFRELRRLLREAFTRENFISGYECTGTDCLKGSMTENVVPFPGLLATSIRPWCSSTMRRASDSPSPVPFPLVVKNGRKIF